MVNQGREPNEIYDLMAMYHCEYCGIAMQALGMVHTLYKPIPGRFKDFIAMPKPICTNPAYDRYQFCRYFV